VILYKRRSKRNAKISLGLINYDEWGSGGIAPPFLSSALYGGELLASPPSSFTPRYQLYRRLGMLQCWSGRSGGENNLLPFLGIKLTFLGLPGRSLVAIPAHPMRYELLVSCSCFKVFRL
jgi:hypothetical protein